MEKALFKITCTTCRARLVVRAEAAIGAILECPKCASMVHITPPEGWQPPLPPDEGSLATTPPGPPPLSRVAASLTLELEPAHVSPLSRLLHQKWLLWGVAPPALTLSVVVVLLWLVFARSGPKPVAIQTASPTTAVAQVAADQSASVDRREMNELASAPPTLAAGDSKAIAPGSKSSEAPATQLAANEPSRSPTEKTSGPTASSSAAENAADGTAEETRPIEIKRAPPPRIDVAARLADSVAEIKLTEMPLAAALDVLAAMSTLPITLDPDAMERLGVTPRDPISLDLTSVNMGKLLRAAAAQRGLAATVDNGQVLITSPAEYRETLRKVRYAVSDLTGDEKNAADELAAVARKLVAPDSWQGSGGRGTIETEADALTVVQTGDVHQQLLVFCEKLRSARQKPLRSREASQRFALAAHLDQAKGMLDKPVTANFHQSAPLAAVLAFLAGATKSDILVDRAALATAETSDRVEVSLSIQKEKLGATLAELLRPLGLTYRAIGPNSIQVTTREAAEERTELEFYPAAAWLANGTSPLALVERLKTQVAPATWSELGGPGEVCFDPPSQYLMVLQSQPVQAAIGRFLATKGEAGGRKGE